jgi:hypothetical protein
MANSEVQITNGNHIIGERGERKGFRSRVIRWRWCQCCYIESGAEDKDDVGSVQVQAARLDTSGRITSVQAGMTAEEWMVVQGNVNCPCPA